MRVSISHRVASRAFPASFCETTGRSDIRSAWQALRLLEEQREQRWARLPEAVELKLRWRAVAIQHTLEIVPGETILELGAGSGMLTAQMERVLRAENEISSVVFSPPLLNQAVARNLPNVQLLSEYELDRLKNLRFDYVIGTGMLFHRYIAECLQWILGVLKPGGQMLFFEPNVSFPARWLNELRSRNGALQARPLNSKAVLDACAVAGLVEADLWPHDIVSASLGVQWMQRIQAKAVLMEHAPIVRSGCASVCLRATAPGVRIRPTPGLAEFPPLFDAVSIVVPAHNEAPNIAHLVGQLELAYGPYIHEIVLVNDNSTDDTAAVVESLARHDSKLRLVNRSKPNGVGLALRDGYQAATGRYILSMDCDFVEILPQFRGLFRAVAAGHDGAIGSRFSHESILINYPIGKLFFNRACHALIKLFLWSSVRDITNNLKLYRSEILRGLEIKSQHFSANLETGLKPLLAGYDIVEVPISWINRTSKMGTSKFYLRRVGLAYVTALFACWREGRTRSRGMVQLAWRRLVRRLSRTTADLT